ncbi:uncharacterized protein LOC130442413 isoform X2 [Diorhabda sublineata]|uniref:uncharacterized protein LOC130442413 isoform X2 n=1 Tax=Diorhabda sublineata TaxID=1163346 RepID=UPI0024E089BA|nr:uncharacterized protein LOC130442413 isoform X2 [Diorhabda sublineata]
MFRRNCHDGELIFVYAEHYLFFLSKHFVFSMQCNISLKNIDFMNITSENMDKLSTGLLCINKMFEMQNEQGDYVPEKVRSYFEHVAVNKDNIEKIVNNCTVKSDGTTAKEAALKLFTCAIKIDTLRFPYSD